MLQQLLLLLLLLMRRCDLVSARDAACSIGAGSTSAPRAVTQADSAATAHLQLLVQGGLACSPATLAEEQRKGYGFHDGAHRLAVIGEVSDGLHRREQQSARSTACTRAWQGCIVADLCAGLLLPRQ